MLLVSNTYEVILLVQSSVTVEAGRPFQNKITGIASTKQSGRLTDRQSIILGQVCAHSSQRFYFYFELRLKRGQRTA